MTMIIPTMKNIDRHEKCVRFPVGPISAIFINKPFIRLREPLCQGHSGRNCRYAGSPGAQRRTRRVSDFGVIQGLLSPINAGAGVMSENVVTAEALEERLIANPFNNWMGLKVLKMDEDMLEIGLSWREERISNPRARNTHGGIIGALVDVAADFAIMAKHGTPVPTVDMRVDYHRAAMPGDLRAVGHVIRIGGTFSVAEASVYDGEDKLEASGRGTYFTQTRKE